MSEVAENNDQVEAPKVKKKRRQVWNESRRLTLLTCLLDGPKDTVELFEAFRAKEKYRGLTFERVVREAKAMASSAVEGDGDLYVVNMPPARKVEKAKRLTVADKRRLLIEAHAKKMTKRKRDQIMKARAEAAEAVEAEAKAAAEG